MAISLILLEKSIDEVFVHFEMSSNVPWQDCVALFTPFLKLCIGGDKECPIKFESDEDDGCNSSAIILNSGLVEEIVSTMR